MNMKRFALVMDYQKKLSNELYKNLKSTQQIVLLNGVFRKYITSKKIYKRIKQLKSDRDN